jgi:hypothetical protein
VIEFTTKLVPFRSGQQRHRFSRPALSTTQVPHHLPCARITSRSSAGSAEASTSWAMRSRLRSWTPPRRRSNGASNECPSFMHEVWTGSTSGPTSGAGCDGRGAVSGRWEGDCPGGPRNSSYGLWFDWGCYAAPRLRCFRRWQNQPYAMKFTDPITARRAVEGSGTDVMVTVQ